jgi:hypothetical protein
MSKLNVHRASSLLNILTATTPILSMPSGMKTAIRIARGQSDGNSHRDARWRDCRCCLYRSGYLAWVQRREIMQPSKLDLAALRKSATEYTQPFEPETVLSLLDRIEDLERRVKRIDELVGKLYASDLMMSNAGYANTVAEMERLSRQCSRCRGAGKVTGEIYGEPIPVGQKAVEWTCWRCGGTGLLVAR